MNNQLPEVSEKDKKQDILAAYFSLLERLQKGEGMLTETAGGLKQTATDLKTSTSDQIKFLSETMVKNVDEVTSRVELLASSLGKLQEIKSLEELKLRQEKDEAKKLWAREQEEYAYQTKRQQAQENDEWEAEKQKREEALTEREARLKEAEVELNDLRNKDKTFEARVTKEVSAAVNDVTAKLQAEQAHKDALELSRREAEKQLLESKVESLTRQVAAQLSEISRLNEQIDAANSRLTDIASSAVRTYKINNAGKEEPSR